MIVGMKPLVIGAALAAIASVTTAAQTKAPTTKELYGSMCQACHGPDGKSPMKEMAFVAREWTHGTKTADMIKVITNGVPGTVMMPFKGRLTEEQIRDLARYVRALDKKLPPEKKK